MLACAFLILPTVPVAAKRKTLPSPNGCPSFHHRRITGSPPVLSSNFWYRLPHYQPSRLASMAPQSTSIAFPIKSTELREEDDFESILTPEGYLYVCGFGSLLSERSARSTFPNVKNFRVAFLPGFRRVFAHIAPIFYERGIAKEETKEVSSLSVEPCEGEGLIVTVFEIARSEISSFIERENEFRFLATVPEALDGAPFANSAVVCARYSDEEYFQIRCKDFSEILRLRSSSAALKVIKIFTFRIMEGITSIRYGGMISYLVVFILDIVSWQPKTLEKQPMIIS